MQYTILPEACSISYSEETKRYEVKVAEQPVGDTATYPDAVTIAWAYFQIIVQKVKINAS